MTSFLGLSYIKDSTVYSVYHTMKKTLCLVSLIFVSFAAGCEKKPSDSAHTEIGVKTNEANSQIAQVDTEVSAAFQRADEKITAFLDQLENTDTPTAVKQKILCQDFPNVYEKEYMPALVQLNSESTNASQLKKELEFTLKYYQDNLQITCP